MLTMSRKWGMGNKSLPNSEALAQVPTAVTQPNFYTSPYVEGQRGPIQADPNYFVPLIIDNIRLGMDIARAAEALCLTPEQVESWVKTWPKVRTAIKKASADYERDQLLRLRAHTEKNWIPAMTLLERKWPESWGQRTVKAGNLSNQISERIKRCFKSRDGAIETVEVERTIQQRDDTPQDVVAGADISGIDTK